MRTPSLNSSFVSAGGLVRCLSARMHHGASTDPRAYHARSGSHGAPGHMPNRWLEHAGKLPRNNNGENVKRALLHLSWSEALGRGLMWHPRRRRLQTNCGCCTLARAECDSAGTFPPVNAQRPSPTGVQVNSLAWRAHAICTGHD